MEEGLMRSGTRAVLGIALLPLEGGGAWAALSGQGEIQVTLTPDERKIIKEYYGAELVLDKTMQKVLDVIRDAANLLRDLTR